MITTANEFGNARLYREKVLPLISTWCPQRLVLRASWLVLEPDGKPAISQASGRERYDETRQGMAFGHSPSSKGRPLTESKLVMQIPVLAVRRWRMGLRRGNSQ